MARRRQTDPATATATAPSTDDADAAVRAELLARAEARRELQRRRALAEARCMVPWVFPGYDAADHLRDFAAALDRSVEEPVLVGVEGPPRVGKTDLVLAHIVRLFLRRPRSRVAYATHGAELANEKSRALRRLAAEQGLFVGPERARGDRRDPAATVRYWQTQGGGAFVAGGRGGGFVGRGFDLIVIDDPYASRSEADSPQLQEKVWDLYRGTLRTRLEPGGSVIVMHHRYNDEDLLARLRAADAEEGEWEFLRYQMVADLVVDDAGAFVSGVPLMPSRYDLRACEALSRDAAVGLWEFWAQYQQQPRPRGQLLFAEPGRWFARDPFGFLVISADPAATTKTQRDPSAIVVGAVSGVGDEMVLDIVYAAELRQEIPELVETLYELQTQTYPGAPVIVEAVGGFKAVPQVLQRLGSELRIHEVNDGLDKFLRAQPAAQAWNQGRIRVPAAAPDDWDLPLYLKRMSAFTGAAGGKLDDLTDATAHLWTWAQTYAVGARTRARSGVRSAIADSPF